MFYTFHRISRKCKATTTQYFTSCFRLKTYCLCMWFMFDRGSKRKSWIKLPANSRIRLTNPLSLIPSFRIGENHIFLRYRWHRSADLPINLLKPLERTSSVRRDYLNLLSTPLWAEIGTVFVRFPRIDNAIVSHS